MTRRVAITGYGIISCLGATREEVRDSLRAGRSGIQFLPERKELGFRSALAGVLPELDPPDVPRRTLRQMGPAPRIATHAAHQALAHSGLPEELLRSERTSMIIGHCGCMHDIYELCRGFEQEGKTLPGTALQKGMNDTVSANLSVLLGTRGYSFTVSAACATGAVAIGQAYQLIQWGLQDRAVCGGVMEDTWEAACHFDALKAFSPREDAPTEASRPFDQDRDGLVLSGGGSILVLEELESARARGATIHAEVCGFSFASDAHDMTVPSGEGGARAVREALKGAELEPDAVDYINAHATATPAGDVVEAKILAEIFGTGPLVSSTKSMTGHEAGAAGSNELVYTLLMMSEGFVAPSINIDTVDPECGGIRIATEAVETPVRVAASNSFGFGGVNTCLVVRRP
jgi:3-oxoacyl-[acyl-carrier-protein] synthase-1